MEEETQTQPSRISRAARWLYKELGLASIISAPQDTSFLFASRFLRMFAYGSSTLILALYFSALGYSDAKIGLFMTLTLVGDVVTTLPLTLFADAWGRRRTLVLGSVMMVASGLVFAGSRNYWLLLIAAILGVISPRFVLGDILENASESPNTECSPSGNEIGPFRAVEQAVLSQLVPSEIRTDIFAWYIVAGTTATACGSLACGWFVQYLISRPGWDDIRAYRVVFLAYSFAGLIKLCLSLCLSDKCEVAKSVEAVEPEDGEPEDGEIEPLLNDTRGSSEIARDEQRQQAKDTKSPLIRMSKDTWVILLKLIPLFAVDSFSSGLVPFSLIAYYIDQKFHPKKGLLGSIMSVTWFFSAFSNIFASAIAKRIGLIQTMVFTHFPSTVFLTLLPLPSQLSGVITLLVLRSTLSNMDQAPRSAFLAAIVLPEERTSVMGIVSMAQTAGRSAGPLVTGLLAAGGKFWITFVVAGALKACYDLVLLALFMNANTNREEEHNESSNATSQ